MVFNALVVDDDAMIRYAIRAILEKAKLQVEEAEDGVEALEKIDTGSFASDTVSATVVNGDVSLADGSVRIDAKAEVLAALLPEGVRPALASNVKNGSRRPSES